MKELKSELKLEENELWLALGWLAREGNIAFGEKDGNQIVYWIF
jgi:hypothetical protein